MQEAVISSSRCTSASCNRHWKQGCPKPEHGPAFLIPPFPFSEQNMLATCSVQHA